jgi:hypothetical protein
MLHLGSRRPIRRAFTNRHQRCFHQSSRYSLRLRSIDIKLTSGAHDTFSITPPQQQRRFCVIRVPTNGSRETFISHRHSGLEHRYRSSRLTLCRYPDFAACVGTVFVSCSAKLAGASSNHNPFEPVYRAR